MVSQFKDTLLNHISDDRMREIARYGRDEIYREVETIIRGRRLEVFQLCNHGMAIIDDIVDGQGENTPNRGGILDMGRLASLLKGGFEDGDANPSRYEDEVIIAIGKKLRILASEGFFKFNDRAIGNYIYNQLMNYFEIEKRNIERRGKILQREELDDLILKIGGSVAAQFLFILDPSLNGFEIRQLARGYGLAVKLADNLVDFREDVPRGFVNVSAEDIHHLQGVKIDAGRLIGVDEENLALSQEYMQKEFSRISRLFHISDGNFYRIALKRPFWHKNLLLAQQIAYTWFRQLQEFMGGEMKRAD